MKEYLKDYLYSGTSIQMYRFDELSFLCAKYKTQFFKFFSFNKIKSILSKDYKHITNREVKYFINKSVNALYDSTLIVEPNNKELKLYSKILGSREAIETTIFKSGDLSSGNLNHKACFIIYKDNEKSIAYYKTLFNESEILYVDDYLGESISNVIDKIELELLKDDSELYFIDAKIYTNVIANQIFNLNKAAIVL